MRVYDAPLLTLNPVSQMIPDARHEVAPLALASRKQDLDDVPFPARFNDGRFRVRTEAKLRPLARFGCSMVWRLISAFIEASRVNETMRRLHFSTPRRWVRVPCSRAE